MSSLIVSHNLHLMMLEVAVKNLFVPWISEFDKIILKKTIVDFRMLDNEWTSLSPNRHDHRPYCGSNYENENFYGGRSVVFCVSTDFFEKKAYGIDVQFCVQKEVCKYLEVDSCQTVGFAAVSVNDLLNSIAKQIRQRNELAEHLSDFYKRQIISRSTTGTYTLCDENLRNTTATISLYIRISYLGKCLITDITRVESAPRTFCVRGELDEGQYLSRELTPEELQSGLWNGVGFPRFPYGRLTCRCEELVGKKSADLATTRGSVAAAAAIATTTAVTDAAQDTVTIAKTATIDVAADSAVIPVAKITANAAVTKIGKALADVITDSAAISIAKDAANIVAIKRRKVPIDVAANPAAIFVAKVATNAATIKKRKKEKKNPADYDVLGDMVGVAAPTNAHKRTMIPLTKSMIIDDEIINSDQGDTRIKGPISSVIKEVKLEAAMKAKTKGHAIRDNGRTAFKKAISASSKSKSGRNTTTIGITERGKRISPLASPPVSCLQTYSLCCQLQPHLTCFIDCFNVSPCYYHWTACPFQFFYTV